MNSSVPLPNSINLEMLNKEEIKTLEKFYAVLTHNSEFSFSTSSIENSSYKISRMDYFLNENLTSYFNIEDLYNTYLLAQNEHLDFNQSQKSSIYALSLVFMGKDILSDKNNYWPFNEDEEFEFFQSIKVPNENTNKTIFEMMKFKSETVSKFWRQLLQSLKYEYEYEIDFNTNKVKNLINLKEKLGLDNNFFRDFKYKTEDNSISLDDLDEILKKSSEYSVTQSSKENLFPHDLLLLSEAFMLKNPMRNKDYIVLYTDISLTTAYLYRTNKLYSSNKKFSIDNLYKNKLNKKFRFESIPVLINSIHDNILNNKIEPFYLIHIAPLISLMVHEYNLLPYDNEMFHDNKKLVNEAFDKLQLLLQTKHSSLFKNEQEDFVKYILFSIPLFQHLKFNGETAYSSSAPSIINSGDFNKQNYISYSVLHGAFLESMFFKMLKTIDIGSIEFFSKKSDFFLFKDLSLTDVSLDHYHIQNIIREQLAFNYQQGDFGTQSYNNYVSSKNKLVKFDFKSKDTLGDDIFNFAENKMLDMLSTSKDELRTNFQNQIKNIFEHLTENNNILVKEVTFNSMYMPLLSQTHLLKELIDNDFDVTDELTLIDHIFQQRMVNHELAFLFKGQSDINSVNNFYYLFKTLDNNELNLYIPKILEPYVRSILQNLKLMTPAFTNNIPNLINLCDNLTNDYNLSIHEQNLQIIVETLDKVEKHLDTEKENKNSNLRVSYNIAISVEDLKNKIREITLRCRFRISDLNNSKETISLNRKKI